MFKTQRFIIACLVLGGGLTLGVMLAALFTFEIAEVPAPLVVSSKNDVAVEALQVALTAKSVDGGLEEDGLNPYIILRSLHNVTAEDFDRAEAYVGSYVFLDGELQYVNDIPVDTTAGNLSDKGFETFVWNFEKRTGVDVSAVSTEAMIALMGETTASSSDAVDDFVGCTMDALQCPDGSFVGRTGPNCEFTACPEVEEPAPAIAVCGDEQRGLMCTQQYEPVCASYQVQCVTTPCNPIPKTYGNGCTACSDNNVISFTPGECAP